MGNTAVSAILFDGCHGGAARSPATGSGHYPRPRADSLSALDLIRPRSEASLPKSPKLPSNQVDHTNSCT
jgi:hypothetical protein